MVDHSRHRRPAATWLVIGLGLATVMGVFQIVNAVRVMTDAAGFAGYMGLPIEGGSNGFVHVYALRSLFIGIVVLGLVAWKRAGVLAWMAAVGVVLPLGDMWLASDAGAPGATVARHGVIAVYLVATALVLLFAVRRA